MPRTHKSYLAAVTDLARYTHRSPAELKVSDLDAYFEYLATERCLAAASCKVFLNDIRFLYLKVLKWPDFDLKFVVPKCPQRIPELLTRAEINAIIAACLNPKHKMMLTLCYGCGLRVSELTSLRLSHIDSERRVLRIEQGKGALYGSGQCRINSGVHFL